MFVLKVPVMPALSNIQRCSAILLLGSLFTLGCRSASVNTASEPAPVFRSFERAPRPYDDGDRPLLPGAPTEVLPVPGFSEPEVPPSPATQRQRRPTAPATTRAPREDQVDQTSARFFKRRMNQPVHKKEPIPQIPVLPPVELNSEPVPLQTTSATIAGDAAMHPNSSNPIRTRHGNIYPSPASRGEPSRQSSINSPGVKPSLLPQ